MRRSLHTAAVLAFLLALLLSGWQVSKSRSFQFFGELIPRVETDTRVVALTFDDGPTPKGTAAALAVLEDLGVRATFFVTGAMLEEHPELGRLIVASGHALGNHSYSHRRMVLCSPSFVGDEIERTDALIRAAGWRGEIPFRPPYGKRLLVLPYYLQRTGRATILWDIEPESYAEVAASAERIAEHVISNAQPGSIVLLHVMYEGRLESLRAVRLIVNGLRARGYGFVTIQELLVEGAGSAPAAFYEDGPVKPSSSS
jgi:peptidoglycan/xylan/chitin deacetylase (PgdA/CDA1 family)